jgi:hypothetical protein
MDDQQLDLLHMAIREAYLCLRDRNRPQVMVEGRLIYSDAELAAGIRLLAQDLLTAQVERDRLMREVQLLWEARLSGALGRLLDVIEPAQEADDGDWRDHYAPTTVLCETDLQILQALVAVPEQDN